MVATLLVLVLLPRGVDRAIRAQLDALPSRGDTTALLATLDSARARHAAAVVAAQASRVVASASPVARVTSVPPSADSVAESRDSLSVELQQGLTRARTAPLVESYRTLADARLLRDDARVRAVVDSIEQVDREREAYAALGGPDARYATLTARLAALGQRVVRIAEAALAERSASLSSSRGGSAPSSSPALPGAAADSSSAVSDTNSAFTPRAPLLPARAAIAESALVAAATATADTVSLLERSLIDVRRTNADIERRRVAIRSLGGMAIPPFAMLVAALIVGLALGYASAILRELRRPTVGDESEVERLTGARVITHAGSLEAVRDVRTRRRADRMLSPALDPTAEAWQQLHLTLTGLGDVVRTVRIVADQPLLGKTLALNLAAASARESRATFLVEPPGASPLLALLLRQTRRRGMLDVQHGKAELREVITEIPMGRDVSVDVLFPGTPTGNALADAAHFGTNDEVRRVAARYDLTVIAGESPAELGDTPQDIIVCARLGVTTLAWLGQVAVQARGAKHRLRAVLLWAADTPTV